jgi:hypothetical protein
MLVLLMMNACALLTMRATQAQIEPLLPCVFISPAIYYGTPPLGSTFNLTVMIGNEHQTLGGVDSSWDVAGYDLTVSWNNTMINLVAYSEGSFLHQGGATTVSWFDITSVGDTYSLEAVAEKNTDPMPSSGIDSLVQLEFNVSFVSSSYPPPSCPIALGPTDLLSWAHPERLYPPWNGSIYLADLSYPTWHSRIGGTYVAPGENHDVSIDGFITSKSVVGRGYSMGINITTADVGDFTETFNVTAYANATIVASQNVTLPAGNSTTVSIIWNTTDFAYGNYTISAYAEPVPDETDTANNNFTGGVVTVTIPGDINGDFKVSLSDLSLLAKAYGSTPGSPKWNANADINSDFKVSLSDLSILAKHYGQHYP